MSDEIPDFITQVRNPNEPSHQNATQQQQQQPKQNNEPQHIEKPPAQKKSCFQSFFCCASAEDDDIIVDNGNNTNSQTNDGRKKTVGTIPINRDPGTTNLPSNTDNNNDYGINSPRMSGKYPQGMAVYSDDHLLPPQSEKKKGKKCLVLDLDETLVHSSFKLVQCDFVVPVKIEEKTYKVYVAKRPHVDEFMKRCGELYEVVIFTASLAQYADPVVDLLDCNKVVDWRLFRESCTPYKGAYVKDMGRMGRDITQIMIVDNSPHSYLFNRENAIPCESWYNDQNDTELLDMIPVLEKLATTEVTDVKVSLKEMQISPIDSTDHVLPSSDTDEYTEDVTDGSDYTGTGSSEYTGSEGQENEG